MQNTACEERLKESVFKMVNDEPTPPQERACMDAPAGANHRLKVKDECKGTDSYCERDEVGEDCLKDAPKQGEVVKS